MWTATAPTPSPAIRGGALAGQLCIGDGDTPININNPVLDTLPATAFLGEIDRNWTSTYSFGGTVQATSTQQFLGHDNHFVMGMSLDRGLTQFTATSELGTIDSNLFVQGTGVYINQPGDDIAPVNLFAKNLYTGIYATDTLDVTDKLSVTSGARLNIAQIDLLDQTYRRPAAQQREPLPAHQPGGRRDLQVLARRSPPMPATPRPTARRRRWSSAARARPTPASSTTS